MPVRTLLIGAEAALGSGAGNGSNFDNATVVRVFNDSGADRVISVAKSTTSGYANTATCTMHSNHVEFFEKGAQDHIFASGASVLGTKVGFTG